MKKFWIILGSVLIVAIIGGSTYLMMNKRATKDKDNMQAQIDDLNNKLTSTEQSLADAQDVIKPNANTNSSSGTVTAPTQTTATNDPTASWKTYSSSTYAYSIKYPSDWTVKDMHTTFGADDTFGIEPPNTSANWMVTVDVSSSDSYPSSIFQGDEGQAATFAGKSATKFTYDNGYAYEIQANGLYYIVKIETNDSLDSAAVKSTGDQIVQTFKLN